MTLLFIIIMALSSGDRARLVEEDVNNLLAWEAEINVAAHRYDVPAWVVAGVLFNESNFRPLKRGKNIGHGQINCGVWLRKLREKKIAHRCDDLLLPFVSIHATSFILSELTKQKKSRIKGNVSWPHVLSYYRWGYGWDKADKGYYRRVYFYGKNLRSYWKDRRIQWCQI